MCKNMPNFNGNSSPKYKTPKFFSGSVLGFASCQLISVHQWQTILLVWTLVAMYNEEFDPFNSSSRLQQTLAVGRSCVRRALTNVYLPVLYICCYLNAVN